MKPIVWAAIISATMFSACNPEAKTAASLPASKEVVAEMPAPTTPATLQIIDPVCGMVKDSTWTDYTIYKGDTVWFCAAQEKTAFLAKPEKYLANLPKHSSN